MQDIREFLCSMTNDFYLIKADELSQKLNDQDWQKQVYFLDLRPPEEFAKDGLPGAKQCFLRDLPDRYTELFPDRDKPLIVYCNGGIQSLYAVVFLVLQGYRKARSLAGGYKNFNFIKNCYSSQ